MPMWGLTCSGVSSHLPTYLPTRLRAKAGHLSAGVARQAHRELAVVLGELREEVPRWQEEEGQNKEHVLPRTFDKILFPEYLELLRPAVSWTVLMLIRSALPAFATNVFFYFLVEGVYVPISGLSQRTC